MRISQSLILVATVLTLLTLHPTVVRAGWLESITEEIKEQAGRVTSVDATIDFRNETDKPIVVVMDNNREAHTIAPGGQSTFNDANVGDIPTFYVIDPGTTYVIFSRQLNGPIGLSSSYG